jgi:hypothetical protein
MGYADSKQKILTGVSVVCKTSQRLESLLGKTAQTLLFDRQKYICRMVLFFASHSCKALALSVFLGVGEFPPAAR